MASSSSRKRPRTEIAEESRAECPFTVRIVDPKEKEQKAKKRRKQIDAGGAEEDVTKKVLEQLSPFAPSGKFKSHETMDYHYAVEPAKRWSEMTRYNSFVLNGVKYYSEGFVYVANESTIEKQKAAPDAADQIVAKSRSDDDWVARILEIRASDEHHVYARVYWMYWPDELPGGTMDGKKSVQGRQPYHGVNELVASNHMDIINVVSVTSQAQVNQMFEENDDDVHNTLYWRQAIDVRTFELSGLVPNCKCGQPGNPDKVLVGCPRPSCNKWLHDECLKHDILTKVYERLGKDKPHVKTEKDNNGTEAKRPLSPSETGTAVSAKPSIDVKSDPDGAAAGEKKEDASNVKPDTDAPKAPEASTSVTPAKAEEPALENGKSKKPTAVKKSTWPSDPKFRPYEGLYTASARLDLNPPVMEITDLRGIAGGEEKWMEPIICLCCGHEMV